ncbi:ankyrin repeat protein [Oesophagostomum dentatum]|uniref:Ankyrin repeat protein n=1 Tax=Oesophagostomum dentatum TaxID=61180 RepID=A0A0B1SVB2_OESDE|nr:ankyrin repeat protein [Oesophagostomum dentatum]
MKKRVVYWIVEYEPLLDSCDMTFDDWIRVATDIRKAYHNYDGFVVLHGTDTLAYTASALSFMMENLGKPVIITGSQIPVAEVRSDGMENLIGALIIAGNFDIPEILYDIGVIPGSDMTSEAAMAKMCYVLGKDEWDYETKRMMMQSNLRGEMTVTNEAVGMRELDIIPHIAKCLRLSSGNELQLIRDTILPPLFCNAAKTNKPEILKSIKEAGVNFSAPDYNLRTALHVAASNGNLEAVRYLLSIGENVHVRDLFGYNPLLCAVKAKSRKCVEEIRKAGGMIDIPQFKLGVDLCLAAAHGDVEQLRCWRAAGSDLTETDYDKRTALHVAVTHYQIEAVKYLTEEGLDPNVVDEFGTTPITEAQRKNYKDILKILTMAAEKRANGNGSAEVEVVENTQ